MADGVGRKFVNGQDHIADAAGQHPCLPRMSLYSCPQPRQTSGIELLVKSWHHDAVNPGQHHLRLTRCAICAIRCGRVGRGHITGHG
jgi:hypothetical protein